MRKAVRYLGGRLANHRGHSRLSSAMLVVCLALWAGRGAAAAPLGAFATDPDAPIEIEADRLDVEQGKQTATFIGNVVAVQGTVILRADRLKVTYADKQSAAQSGGGQGAGGGGNRITEIRARGDVHVTSEGDQSADGEWAIYEVASRQITMGDKVVLRQAGNVVRGTKLRIDLNSGQSRIDGGVAASTPEKGSNGRVRGLFLAPKPE